MSFCVSFCGSNSISTPFFSVGSRKCLVKTMNAQRLTSKVKTSYITDPYALLMHYKRAFKFLNLVQQNNGKILILGNKNHFGIKWTDTGSNGGNKHMAELDTKVVSTASRFYSLILCLDPVLWRDF